MISSLQGKENQVTKCYFGSKCDCWAPRWKARIALAFQWASSGSWHPAQSLSAERSWALLQGQQLLSQMLPAQRISVPRFVWLQQMLQSWLCCSFSLQRQPNSPSLQELWITAWWKALHSSRMALNEPRSQHRLWDSACISGCLLWALEKGYSCCGKAEFLWSHRIWKFQVLLWVTSKLHKKMWSGKRKSTAQCNGVIAGMEFSTRKQKRFTFYLRDFFVPTLKFIPLLMTIIWIFIEVL